MEVNEKIFDKEKKDKVFNLKVGEELKLKINDDETVLLLPLDGIGHVFDFSSTKR